MANYANITVYSVRVYDRSLTQTEIEDITNGTENTNSAPSADFSYSTSDLTVDTDGSQSSYTDGSISSYEWNWNASQDNTYDATGQTASHTYDSNGTYDVKLRVTDNDGATDTVTNSVTVDSGTSSSNSSNTTAYYDFTQSYKDQSSNGNDGTPVGNPTRNSSGLYLEGMGNGVNASDFDVFGEMTVGTTFKYSTVSSTQHLFASGYNGNNNGYEARFFGDDTRFDWQYWDGSNYHGIHYQPGGSAFTDEWVNLTTVVNATHYLIYEDHNLIASKSASVKPVNVDLPSSVGILRDGGNGVWTNSFNGIIRNYRIYNTSLNQSQIKAIGTSTDTGGSTSDLTLTVTSPENRTFYRSDIGVTGSTNLKSNISVRVDGGSLSTVATNTTSFSTSDTFSVGTYSVYIEAVRYNDSSNNETRYYEFTVEKTFNVSTEQEFNDFLGFKENISIDTGGVLSLLKGETSGVYHTIFRNLTAQNMFDRLEVQSSTIRNFTYHTDFTGIDFGRSSLAVP